MVAPPTRSRAQVFASVLEREERAAELRAIRDRGQLRQLPYEWGFWARPDQLVPPGDWYTWLIIAGRGYGKTRTGAETIRAWQETGKYSRFALIGRTPADVRDTMIEGESGILAISPPTNYPKFEPSKRRLTWPNGAIATTYTSQEPDVLRGPQHDAAWGDEVATWRYMETYDNLQMGLRLGSSPRQIFTTTPRPVALIRQLVKRAADEKAHEATAANPKVVVTRGSSYANRSNLTPQFFEEVIAPYEGTERGRQEVYGELLEEAEGALWTRSAIDDTRVTAMPGTMRRIVVAIDPAGGGGDEIGIVVAGLGGDKEWYVLEDASLRGRPEAWAARAVEMYRKHNADLIVAEKNYGGDMVESTIRTAERGVPVKMVTASRGKAIRAEPISFAYSKGKIHHVGSFDALEDQMCNWSPTESTYSPDRLDALVWAMTELRAGIGGGTLRSALRT